MSRAKLLPLVAFLLATLMGVALTCSRGPAHSPARNEGPAPQLESLTIWRVGSDNDLLRAVLGELQRRGASVYCFDDLPTQAPPKGALVIFDGDWIYSASNDHRCLAFLQRTGKSCCLVAIGGRTSGLFDALDKADVYKLDRFNGAAGTRRTTTPPWRGSCGGPRPRRGARPTPTPQS
jgi:hypothetical protein